MLQKVNPFDAVQNRGSAITGVIISVKNAGWLSAAVKLGCALDLFDR